MKAGKNNRAETRSSRLSRRFARAIRRAVRLVLAAAAPWTIILAAALPSQVVGVESAALSTGFQTPLAGADVRRQMLGALDQTREALRRKQAEGGLSKEEKELLDDLDGVDGEIEGLDDAALDALAKLASGGTIVVEPDAEAAAGGAEAITITAADIAKAQEDAVRMSAAAEAFMNSPEGRALRALGGETSGNGAGAGAGGSTAASWRVASGVDDRGGTVYGRRGGGGAGVREVTAAAAANADFPPVGDPPTADDIAPTNSLDAVDFDLFHWDFGGFHPATNCVREVVEIADLDMRRDGLSFKYVEDLSAWGLGYGEAEALACLFVLDNDGIWVGGKFDWISTSRQSRDFENIYSGYNGWDLSNVPKTTTAAFVIVSKDGKKRSNVITATWER